ncbi:hypothetical protein GcC1_190002 [Golovinomyces cichoracearum]|uniref:Uncharacterized protein n=1 Tax=Golovinomyces cichoracearum TaxID=62708 RepID=A0A420HIP5_9PEZI|nr:hypothetical protein GcC1_190002 [Golovinomyces cichoracearum]
MGRKPLDIMTVKREKSGHKIQTIEDINPQTRNTSTLETSTEIQEQKYMNPDKSNESFPGELVEDKKCADNPVCTPRILRTKTKSGLSTRENYAELARFNPRDHIR